MKQSSITDL